MNKFLDKLQQKVSQLVNEELTKSLFVELDQRLAEFIQLQQLLTKIYCSPDEVDVELAQQKANALKAIANLWQVGEPTSFNEFSPVFSEQLAQAIDALPESLSVDQKSERFVSLETDDRMMGLKKSIKGLCYRSSQLPLAITNLFRKAPRQPQAWTHKVPLRNLAQKQLLANMSREFIPYRTAHYPSLSKAYQLLKVWEESIDFQTPPDQPQFEVALRNDLEAAKQQITAGLAASLETLFTELRNNADKVGTIELSDSPFSEKAISSSKAKNEAKWIKACKDWNRTFDALMEEWRSDLEITRLMLLAHVQSQSFQQEQLKHFHEQIDTDLGQLIAFTTEVRSQVEDGRKDLMQVLHLANERAQKELDRRLIPQLVEKLGNKFSIHAITYFESQVQADLDELTIERSTIKEPSDYLRPVASSEMTTISLFELITFETAPTLRTTLNRLKSELLNKLNEHITTVRDLDHMITFGIRAVIQQLAESPKAITEARTTAINSLDRSQQRIIDIQEALQQLVKKANQEVSEAITTYSASLEALMNNESLRDIRMRIVKAKALQQTANYKKELRDKAQSRVRLVLRIFHNLWMKVIGIIDKIRQRFILTAKKESASKEIADFLAYSQEAINALPVIYRNLYRIEPLSDLELFVGRSQEYDQLLKAYHNWEKGRMGSCIITGEKWSGLTSFMNYVEYQTTFQFPVARKCCETEQDNAYQLLTLMGEILGKSFQTPDQIASSLNEGVQRIIILEDIQNLYLKKVGGFIAIKSLMELISKTSKNVLWITTCTLYTFKYFQQTFQIREVFSYHIDLQKPSPVEMTNMVEKRNRISGYKIEFNMTMGSSETRKLEKWSNEEQQKYLKTRFFKQLIDFAESNISMALMYWLLSTTSVDQDKIVIGEFRKPDLSFLMTLDMTKVMALHQLLLHDGLNLEMFAEVSQMKKQAAYLQLSMLFEDGILILIDQQYLVNPMVYRSVTSLLKAKNLIY